MERKLPGKYFRKIWVYLERLFSFLDILENAVLEVAENSNQTFWLDGKRP